MLRLFEILYSNTMILKIFVCHYNSEAHNNLIPSITIHTMNKIQVVESLFHRYPNLLTTDIKYFCQQSTIFLSFAQVFSQWSINKVHQVYESFRTRPLNQIFYENFILCTELMKYVAIEEEQEVPYFIKVIIGKHSSDILLDIENFKRRENQIQASYKTATLQTLLPPNDYSLPDQVHLKIWNTANLPF